MPKDIFAFVYCSKKDKNGNISATFNSRGASAVLADVTPRQLHETLLGWAVVIAAAFPEVTTK